MRIINAQEIQRIISKDYSNPSTVDINQSYIMINTWLQMFEDFGIPNFSSQLYRTLCVQGLRETIAAADATALSFIKGELTDESLFSAIAFYLEDPIKILQLLRFPKRFAYRDDDTLAKGTIKSFCDTNNRIKMFDRRELPYWLVQRLHRVASTFFKNMKADGCYTLPTGATAELSGSATTASHLKYNLGQRYIKDLGTVNYAYDGGDRNRYYDGTSYLTYRNTYCVAVTVPKNYKSARLIAKEETDRQILSGPLKAAIEAGLSSTGGKYGSKGRVTIEDQSRNQRLAMKGSVDGTLSTIDLSAASDSISAQVAHAVLPESLFKQITDNRSNYIVLPNGKKKTLYLFKTMGSRETFPLETLIFWVICMVAREIAGEFGITTRLSDYSVYGDDIIVPTIVFETVCDILSMCGFKVNTEKSYASGSFRESCGEDYYDGLNVSSKYWPRKVITGDKESTLSLISLQHRLYNLPCCSNFLMDVIYDREPSIKQSKPGVGEYDIWTHFPVLETDTPEFIGQKRVLTGKFAEVESVTVSRTFKCTRVTSKPTYYARTKEVENYLYNEFLEHGPSYSTPLDRLLNVSTKREVIKRTQTLFE